MMIRVLEEEAITYIVIIQKKIGKKYSISCANTENLERGNFHNDNETIEEKLNQFLGLLKNTTGEIPALGTTPVFNSNGIVVKYGDIYYGTIPAGDLLLDNGALMLFDLLEKPVNTQNLVNVFKYLAYLYTGTDYGVTDISEFADLFSFLGGFSGSSSSGFWWPIGSSATTTEGGKLFATGMPVIASYGDGFGMRWHPIDHIWKFHDGWDIRGSYGHKIIAVKDGTVTTSQKVDNGGYGIYVDINHGNGIKTRYAHMSTNIVNVGDTVKQGQVIGYVGSTGASTGAHLHFEVIVNGVQVDPGQYINPNNPRPVSSIGTAAFTLPGRNQSYYKLSNEQVRLFTAVIIGEGGTDLDSVFWTASAMFNRIDARYYGDTDAMKILTRGWSEVYNRRIYTRYYSSITNEISQVVQEVINGKRAHKYIDFACDVPGYPLASNWIANHPGKKYEWFKGNMYCDWRDSIN